MAVAFIQCVLVAAIFLAATQAEGQFMSSGNGTEHVEATARLQQQQLQTLLDKAVQNSRTPGAVMLVKTPAVEWLGASGLANVAEATAMKPSDVLRLGSMTKTFTAATVVKLAQEGKLDLDDKISGHLHKDQVYRVANWNTATVRQLLNHISGVYDYIDDQWQNTLIKTPYRTWTAQEVIVYTYDKPASFEPGTRFEYSNTNYVLLELIVENVTKSALAAEIRRTILTPLALQSTFMEIKEPRQNGFGSLSVHGYENGRDVTRINDALGLGDGGLISGAKDLVGFLDGLLASKTLLNAGYLAQVQTIFGNSDYGLGIDCRKSVDLGVAWGHSGATAGFSAEMLYYPTRDAYFILLTNDVESDLYGRVFPKAMHIALGMGV